MIFMLLMRPDNLLKIICISIIFLYACTSNQLTNTADSCIIFDQKKNWYNIKQRPDVIIFEGWCVGARAESNKTLKRASILLKKLMIKNLFGENMLIIN